MNVRNKFKTAAFLAASVAAAAFAPSAFAAIKDGQCASLSDLKSENQGSVLESQKLTSDGYPLPTKLLYTSTPTGERGYEIEWTPGSECFLVNKTLADIQMQDPNSKAIRREFFATNPALYESLKAGTGDGDWPSLQATIVSGKNAGTLLTVVKSPSLRAMDGQLTGIVLISTPTVTKPIETIYRPTETNKAAPLYGLSNPSLAAN